MQNFSDLQKAIQGKTTKERIGSFVLKTSEVITNLKDRPEDLIAFSTMLSSHQNEIASSVNVS